MPFQSEKQRRFLHANHPEIAKRWERDYANGGISNHFRKKFDKGSDYGQFERRQAHNVAAGSQAMNVGGGQDNQGTGGGPKPHSGPTAAELAAAKAATIAAAKAAAEAKHKKWLGEQKTKKTKKVKHLKNLNKNKNWLWKGDKLGKKFYKNVDLKKAWDMEKKWGYNPNYKGKGAINIGKNPNIFQKGLGFGKYLTQALTSPGSNISGGTPLMRTLAMQPFKMAARAVPVVGAAITAYDLANAYGKFVKSDLARKEEDPEAYAAEQEEQMGMSAAHGGVARKNYYHGGILDIDASEEIISDDGNDIELTAYNAEFDDPNDLSTGVKTLFQAKDGGTPRRSYFTGAYGVGGTENENQGNQNTGSQYHGGGADVMAVSTPKSTGIGGDTSRTRIQEETQEDFRQKEMAKTLATGPGSDWEKYDTDLVDTKGDSVMTPEENYLARRNMIKSKYTGRSIQRKNALNKNYNDQRAKLEKAMNKKIFKIFGLAFLGKPPTLSSLISFDPFAEKKLTGLLPEAYALDELKKQHIADLTDIKESLLGQVDVLNPNEMKSKIGTQISDITNEIKDLTKKREEDDIENNESPVIPQVVPIGEEIDEYEGTYAMSPWERIKANQAKRAMLVEKGIIQDNPIVDDSVTDITMTANSGGLANLFRVKNK